MLIIKVEDINFKSTRGLSGNVGLTLSFHLGCNKPKITPHIPIIFLNLQMSLLLPSGVILSLFLLLFSSI